MRSVSNRSVATMPANAGSTTSSVATESKTGSLSSCRSRLYASGRPLSVASSPVRLPIEPAGLAARELGDVGVLLLRHDARAGRVAVVEGHEAELAGVPEDDLLGEAREVDADHRRDEGELGHDIARRRAVERVLGGPGEAELARDELRVESERRAGERSAAVGRDRRARRPVAQPLEVAHERPRVRLQVVGEQDRLRVLQVRAPGHDRRRGAPRPARRSRR